MVLDIFQNITKWIPFFEIILIAIVIIFIFNFFVLFVKRRILKKAKSKNQVSTIKIFSRMINIVFTWVIILFAFLSYFKSWTGIGVVAGLLTAAIGFALQKPITGIAAWIMVVVKRPFQVGDRISIGSVKGDVYDISLTHVHIDEIGGTVDSEQHSGRNVLVPNYKLFDDVLINHTLIHDFVLDEVSFIIKYDSDLDGALKIVTAIAEEITGEYAKKLNREIATRVSIVDNGMKIKILFYAPVQNITKIKSDLSEKIYKSILKNKKVELAYNRLDISVKKDKALL
jgi:small-conductance mechanosensitive channel